MTVEDIILITMISIPVGFITTLIVIFVLYVLSKK